jgi:hypothetical protein
MSNLLSGINISMKYQMISHEHITNVAGPEGWDWGLQTGANRDRDHPLWPDYNVFRRKVIDNGGFDSQWGPLDSINPLVVDGTPNESFAEFIVTFNTLEAASELFDMRVGQDNNPKSSKVYYVKLTEVQDDGTLVSVIKESNSMPLDFT